jgi:hypothetical protein
MSVLPDCAEVNKLPCLTITIKISGVDNPKGVKRDPELAINHLGAKLFEALPERFRDKRFNMAFHVDGCELSGEEGRAMQAAIDGAARAGGAAPPRGRKP